MKRTRYDVAIHEAGHAIFALKNGPALLFTTVDTFVALKYGGMFANGYTHVAGKIDFSTRDLTMAGIAAQIISGNPANPNEIPIEDCRGDLRKLEDILTNNGMYDQVPCQAICSLFRAEQFAKQHIRTIRGVADSLMERGTLSATEVADIMTR